MAKSLYAIIKNNLRVTKIFHIQDAIKNDNKALSLAREINGKPFTFYLEFIHDNVYIRPADYIFKPVSSYGNYNIEEHRWTRRKDVVFTIVKGLKKSAVWPFIKNKDFFIINDNCNYFTKKKGLKSIIKDEFNAIFENDSQKKSRKQIKELAKLATQILKK